MNCYFRILVITLIITAGKSIANITLIVRPAPTAVNSLEGDWDSTLQSGTCSGLNFALTLLDLKSIGFNQQWWMGADQRAIINRATTERAKESEAELGRRLKEKREAQISTRKTSSGRKRHHQPERRQKLWSPENGTKVGWTNQRSFFYTARTVLILFLNWQTTERNQFTSSQDTKDFQLIMKICI